MKALLDNYRNQVNKLILVFLCSITSVACYKTQLSPDLTDSNQRSSQETGQLTTLAATTWYVATNGDDTNPGTIGLPFKTINKALSIVNPGDEVQVRAGTYIEKVSFTRSGTAGNFITLKEYPGETAVISGTGLTVNGYEALVTLNGVNWIIVDGFDINDFKSTTPWVDPEGIVVKGGSDNIILKNNKVYNIEHNVALADGRSAHGILIIGNTSDPLTNITVTGNEIHDCNTGYSENLTINGYVDGFTISNNTLYNCENIGIDAAGGYAANPDPALNYARNGVISGNIVHHVNNTLGPLGGYGAIGIYVDGARNITIERNWVYEADRGIGIVSETNNFPTRDCIVRNNVVYNCWRTGIYLGGYIGYTTGGTINCQVVNNTLYYNDRVPGYFDEIEGEIGLRENCTGTVIRNNIIYGRPTDIFIHKYTTSGSGNVIDHNLYYTTGTAQWTWNGTNYTSFADWKTASGADAHSSNGINPLFVSTAASPDLHIRPTSPAKNSGENIASAGFVDIDGQPRLKGSRIDKGADELQ